MLSFFIKWLINIIALFLVINIVAGVSVDSWQAIVVAAFVLGLLNAFLRPFVIAVTLPINIISLGFFTLIINGFMFYLAAKFVKGFNVSGFWNAFWAALLFSIVSFLLTLFVGPARISMSSQKTHDDRDDVIDVEGKVER